MFKNKDITISSLLVALGIVYGDIGTSPLYVMQAILYTNDSLVSKELILGGVSLVFWTLTLQTTIKYVILTLQADNSGEGGILALYALVKRYFKWLIVPAIIGVAAILADGILTPPISVSSAIEGLNIIVPLKENVIIFIVLLIISIVFSVQKFGTEKIGKIFGPAMFVWFSMIGSFGLIQLIQHLEVLEAINPYYAFKLIKNGNVPYILGAVFLCTTGAEALYSDLGHCGKENIYYSWIFVKITLLLSYFGQGAYLLKKVGETIHHSPFFLIMPSWFIIPGVIIATIAAIIASQALISGSFTLISEAIKLNIFPKLAIKYPTNEKGQVYIGTVNKALFIGCIGIVFIFKKSQNMQAAYGLSITITMLMTTLLLSQYLRFVKNQKKLCIIVLLVFGSIELTFLYANSFKILSGGYVTLLITAALAFIMYTWHYSFEIKKKYLKFVNLSDYKKNFDMLKNDSEVPLYAGNVVYLTKSKYWNQVEPKVIYSIFNNDPKKADNYWFVNINVMDEPYTMEYTFNKIDENRIFVVDFNLGFKISQGINVLLFQVIRELIKNGDIIFKPRDYMIDYENLKGIGNFKFIIIEEVLALENDFSTWDSFIISTQLIIKKFTVSPQKWYGIDTSVVDVEKVPILFGKEFSKENLKRID
ncbi:KUP/HAK/KT family potassium transporter [uncultured Cetobacterium sp.]|uniref:KUP/HAK/KT family potassium transporter n=1 Tax=uncultured Cetobacterium sp. TaxID=527638 RepID=UPI0026207D15|nr:KUP/HAK/KT family potassium transporter [uncultured Cetobacterium sp.]